MNSKLNEVNLCVLHSFELEIPIAILGITHCSKGLHQVKFKQINLNKSDKKIRLVESISSLSDDNYLIRETLNFFESYFLKKNSSSLELPKLCWSSLFKKENTFGERVLRELIKVKFGTRISYSELALRSGSKNAQRAVGTLMKNNKIALIIPCHRVVKSNNSDIGNYNFGVDVKQWLLEHETN